MPQKPNPKNFWNIRSKSFPGHREGDTYQKTMLELALTHGVDFKGKEVIDLGCGAGAYTLRLARLARQVTALDISPGMLGRVREQAEEQRLTNITCICKDWMDYPRENRFDIAFCSLTPALSSEEAFDKLCEQISSEKIYIGFAGPMQAHVLEGLFALYDKRWSSNNKFDPVIHKWLKKHNIAHTIYRHQGEWLTERNHKEMVDNCVDVLTASSLEPDIKQIEDYIERFRKEDDLYISCTDYDVEMVIF